MPDGQPEGTRKMPAATPISAASYVINFPGVEVTFSALTGISSEIVPTAVTSADTTGHIPFGQASPTTVTLQRGVDGSTEIWAWHQAALQGDPAAHKSGTLLLQDASGHTLLGYGMENAWPSSVEVTGLQSGESQTVIETWEFVCDSIIMQPG
jgi:phage tail-like protein